MLVYLVSSLNGTIPFLAHDLLTGEAVCSCLAMHAATLPLKRASSLHDQVKQK